MVPFDVETVVLCDDIRQEGNGKYLLIGVYGGNVVLRGFPTDLQLSLWILARPRKLGKTQAKIRVVGPQDTILAEGGLEVDVKDTAGALIMALPGLPMQVQREGKMRIELASPTDDDWASIKTVDLVLAPTASPKR